MKNHGLLELQIVQTVVVILHCKQFERNGIIAACPSSWNYSVTEQDVGGLFLVKCQLYC